MSKQKRKGTAFETDAVEFLSRRLSSEEGAIHRLAQHGTNDEGDIWGLFTHGKRLVAECKNCKKMTLSQWIDEAEAERGNADALAAIVIHKRRGKGAKQFQETYVSMTLEDFCAILTGEREDYDS